MPPPARNARRSKRAIEAEIANTELCVSAIRLRNAGASVPQIADKLNITPARVSTVITTGLREIMREPAEELIANQQAIIRDVVRAMYGPMAKGDIGATKQLMQALDHQSKLFGLYSPSRVQVGITDEDFSVTASQLMQEIGIIEQDPLPEITDGADGWVDE